MGIGKIRALPHISGDAPKILASATPHTCVHCAASQIRKAGHSSTMDAPSAEPGDLHVDLKGPFPLSTAGKFRYAAFFTDEYTRMVFAEYLHDKSEVIEATQRVMAKFNALVGTPWTRRVWLFLDLVCDACTVITKEAWNPSSSNHSELASSCTLLRARRMITI